jgi:hypothetical protein
MPIDKNKLEKDSTFQTLLNKVKPKPIPMAIAPVVNGKTISSEG